VLLFKVTKEIFLLLILLGLVAKAETNISLERAYAISPKEEKLDVTAFLLAEFEGSSTISTEIIYEYMPSLIFLGYNLVVIELGYYLNGKLINKCFFELKKGKSYPLANFK
jgi:hypothetical protein